MSTEQTLDENAMNALRSRSIALYFCKDTDNPPLQYIFWIDDVWFHGKSESLEGCFFCNSNEENGKVHAIVNAGYITLGNSNFQIANNYPEKPSWNSFDSLLTWNSSRTAPTDAAPGKISSGNGTGAGLTEEELVPKLIEFCDSNRYGLVLCSFEWFFLHMNEIAKHREHAAIFDISYQASQEKDLTTSWTQAFDNPSLSGDFAKSCGIRLYIEFAALCPEQTNTFSVNDHAFVLTSKESFHGDYFSELLSILKTRPDFGGASMLGPKVLPKSRRAGSEALEICLRAFNDSFQKALNVKVKEAKVLEDAIHLWDVMDELGHNPENATKQIYSARFTSGDDKQAHTSQLRALFRPEISDDYKLPVAVFWSLLCYLVEAKALMKPLQNGLGDKTLSANLLPPVFLAIGLARFINALVANATDSNAEDEKKPLIVTSSLRADDGKLKMNICLSDHGTDCALTFLRAISGLEKDGSKCRSTTGSGARHAWAQLHSGMTCLIGELGAEREKTEGFKDYAEKCIAKLNGWPQTSLPWEIDSIDKKSKIILTIGTIA